MMFCENRSAEILEAMAAMIASYGRKERAVGGQKIKADDACRINDGNQSVKDFLIQGFVETFVQIG
jgi:hypothetical protein